MQRDVCDMREGRALRALQACPMDDGDLVHIGEHTVVCGDVREWWALARQNRRASTPRHLKEGAGIGRPVRSQTGVPDPAGAMPPACGELGLGVPFFDLVYSRPPIGPKNLGLFRELTHKERESYEAFLVDLVGVIGQACPSGLVWLESGGPAAELLERTLERAGAVVLMKREIEYGRPAVPGARGVALLVSWSWGALAFVATGVLERPGACWGGVSEAQRLARMVSWTRDLMQLAQMRCERLLDPCAGTGRELVAGVKAGLEVTGVELTPQRAAQAVYGVMNQVFKGRLGRTWPTRWRWKE